MQFTSWPDYGVPLSASAMLEFLQRMRDMQTSLVTALGDTWTGHPLGPPIIVHCSAGIGRTGKTEFISNRVYGIGMISTSLTRLFVRIFLIPILLSYGFIELISFSFFPHDL